ncbi:MAG: ECF-type sigma factor [Thermoguttaceae bacterium]
MTDLTDSSLESLLTDIRNGDDLAITRFWNLHFERLTVLARRKMSLKVQRIGDGEDIALSALRSFLTGLAEQRFQQIKGKNELWNLLTTIVARKIAKQIRKENAQRRGGGTVRGESVFIGPNDHGGENAGQGIANVSRRQTTPYLEVEFLDTCEQFFEFLPDEKTRHIARLIMEGYTLDDVAEELGCVRRTVERKLKQIREIWSTRMTK